MPRTADSPPEQEVTFEVARFGTTSDDRLEVTGRWFGVRGRRFLRPTLEFEVDGEPRRALALLDHKPWTAEEGEEWVAAFNWEDGAGEPKAAELAVGAGLSVPIANGGKRKRPARPRSGKGSAREPTDRERLQQAGRDLERARAALSAETQAAAEGIAGEKADHARTRADLETAQSELEAARSELEEARSEAETARKDLAQARADLEATREEREAGRERVTEAGGHIERLREALNATAAERDALRDERDAAAASRKGAADASERIRAERDDARSRLEGVLAERDSALEKAEAALAERDAIRSERDSAQAERDAARTQRDSARVQRVPRPALPQAEPEAPETAAHSTRLVAAAAVGIPLLILALLILFAL